VAIVIASAISLILPVTQKDQFFHDFAWLLMHPMWGFGFFVLVNRAVAAERSWQETLNQPAVVTVAASIGVFSYSLYLTHELVIMQSWRFSLYWMPPMLNTLLIVVPATVAFAWLFFRYCEKPYMRKPSPKEARAEAESQPLFTSTPALADEA
jgi:peptidoglycan/LPS O-acetylase OafA/YrhL